MSWPRHLCSASLCLALSASAASESSALPLRVGLGGGYALISNELDLGATRKVGYTLAPGGLLSLRVGYDFGAGWGAELDIGTLFSAIDATDASQVLLSTFAKGQWRPLEPYFPVTPLLSVGVGFLSTLGGPAGSDSDVSFQFGLGLEWLALPSLAVRVEAEAWLSDGVTQSLAFVPVMSLGLDWRFGPKQGQERGPELFPIPPSIPTPEEPIVDLSCPSDVPKSACVDSDGDKILDAFDECPLEPGPHPRGCPTDSLKN